MFFTQNKLRIWSRPFWEQSLGSGHWILLFNRNCHIHIQYQNKYIANRNMVNYGRKNAAEQEATTHTHTVRACGGGGGERVTSE